MMNIKNKKNMNIIIRNRKKESTVSIQEIHNSFNTEIERLLEKAKRFENIEIKNKELHEKADKLKSIGFSNTPEVLKVDKEIKELNKKRNINDKKRILIEAIAYFSTKYPSYKFITKKAIIDICKKYNLIYGDVKYYIGNVPDDKLKEMLEFKADEKDLSYTYTRTYKDFNSTENITCDYDKKIRFDSGVDKWSWYRYSSIKEKSFIIAAPQTDFDLDKMQVKDFEIVIEPIKVPDPVVMKPVMFKGEEFYLIVTAWGEEANDGRVKI
jgi:hypothetical protein